MERIVKNVSIEIWDRAPAAEILSKFNTKLVTHERQRTIAT